MSFFLCNRIVNPYSFKSKITIKPQKKLLFILQTLQLQMLSYNNNPLCFSLSSSCAHVLLLKLPNNRCCVYINDDITKMMQELQTVFYCSFVDYLLCSFCCFSFYFVRNIECKLFRLRKHFYFSFIFFKTIYFFLIIWLLFRKIHLFLCFHENVAVAELKNVKHINSYSSI